MKPHLTEDALIKYQFNLCDELEAKEIAEHLQGCGECTVELEKVKGNFAALDLLKEDADLSAELIEETIAYAKKPRKVLMIKRPVWLTAAAVLAVCALAAIVAPFMTGQKGVDSFAKIESAEPVSAVLDEQIDMPFEDTQRKIEPVLAMKVESKAKKLSSALDPRGYKYATAAVVVDADSISDRPPFAPASAIELVVLPKRENIQLTIYNSADLTLVREKRNLTLKAGWNWLQFMWANTLIDPTSLRLEPLEHKDKIDVTELVYPAGLKDIGRWLIRSEVEGQVPFEITYFTSGLSWRAFYTGTLADDEQTMKLDGFVRVANNSGEDYEDAQTRLIVGKVNLLDQIEMLARRAYPYDGLGGFGRTAKSEKVGENLLRFRSEARRKGVPVLGKIPILGDTPIVGMDYDALYALPKEVKKEGLSEYFLYTIEGRESISDKWAKRLPSFQAGDIPVESLYKYDEERYGNATMRYVSFANDAEHELGDTPIPNGAVKVYRNVNETGNLAYVGGAEIKYVPVNEKIELGLGGARLVKVEPVLMDYATDNFMFSSKRDINGYDEVELWKMEVTNSRKLEAKIEITRWFGPNMAAWDLSIEDDNVEYKKHDAERARFTLTVPSESKRVFYYRLRKYHGMRSEHWTENGN